jgi:coenzyme F420-reducing hydrogenase alpha subunit
MPRNYIPKKSFFESTRIHKIAKEIIRDCSEDRQRALDTFDYFKNLVSSNPEDDKSKSEMVHALSLSQDSTDNVVKILDMMIKMTQNEQKIDAQDLKPEEWSFEELRKGG